MLAADLRGCVEAEVESLLISEAEAELELLDADLRQRGRTRINADAEHGWILVS